MPGFYSDGEYDLAGFAVGVVERSQIIDGKKVQAGDVILGLESSGLHSNGYSLVRKILEERAIPLNSFPIGLDRTLIDLLLVPTKIYATEIAALQKRVEVLAIAHITGGGIPGNLPRTLPHETSALVHLDSWPRSPLWNYLAQQGSVPPSEMLTTFNLGIGLTVVVRPEQAVTALQVIHESGTNAWKIGEIVSGEGEPSVKIV
jgi:phosphoribosylformylglycinamidine cyclo-ligase